MVRLISYKLFQLNQMKDRKCPYCANNTVRCGSTSFQHLTRLLSGDRRRYCFSCGKKWKLKVLQSKPPLAYYIKANAGRSVTLAFAQAG